MTAQLTRTAEIYEADWDYCPRVVYPAGLFRSVWIEERPALIDRLRFPIR